MPKKIKLEAMRVRAEKANELIRVIATHGRGFFSRRDEKGDLNIARFQISRTNRIYFIQALENSRVNITKEPYYWRGFEDGGTLKALVQSLKEYIKTGLPLVGNHFGPWPYDCDIWGYGSKGMAAVRDAADRLGIKKKKAGGSNW